MSCMQAGMTVAWWLSYGFHLIKREAGITV